MNIYDSKLWILDLDQIIESLPILSELEGKRVLITGAAGLVCSALVDIIIRYNEAYVSKNKIQILAAGRWPEEMKNRFGPYFQKDYFVYVSYDACKTDNTLELPCDYIIHGASNASPDMILKEPVETMASNFLGLKSLLDYARVVNTKRVLYISSSEVYGKKEDNKPYREEDCGSIDLLDPRSSYSMGKRAAETLCASFTKEYGTEVVIVRPGHIYGPTATQNDKRVASLWSYAAAKGEPIVMKSTGAQIRSYCYCLDCASAILTVLLSGMNIHAYNISNPDSIISIKEMADIIKEIAGNEIINHNPDESERRAFNPMLNSSLDSTKLMQLNWRGLFDARRGFEHTIKIFQSK